MGSEPEIKNATASNNPETGGFAVHGQQSANGFPAGNGISAIEDKVPGKNIAIMVSLIVVAVVLLIVLIVLLCSGEEEPEEVSTPRVTTEVTTEATTVTEAVTEAATEESTEEPTVEVDENSLDAIKRRNSYASALHGVAYGYYPGEEDAYNDDYVLTSQYVIDDVDGDGIEELVLSVDGGDMASLKEEVFQYDIDTDTLRSETVVTPYTSYYSNGTMMMQLSHNQTWSPNFWPYTVYQYDANSDTYIEGVYVDAWEKENYSDGFPTDTDADGDGMVYSINHEYVDNAEYEEWYQSYFGDAQEIELNWKNVEDREYESYAQDYANCVLDNVKAQKQGEDIDIGQAMIEGGGDYKAVESMLEEKLSITMTEEDEITRAAWYDGTRFYYSDLEDATGSVYTNAIEGVTLLGLYPGMSETEANALLISYGFYATSYSYKTGDSFGSYSIYLQSEDGIVKTISISPYGAYVG